MTIHPGASFSSNQAGYPDGRATERDARQGRILDLRERIQALIADRGPMTRAAIAAELGCAANGVSECLKKSTSYLRTVPDRDERKSPMVELVNRDG